MPYQSGSSAQRIRIGLTSLAVVFLIVLVASAIFIIVITAALVLYDKGNVVSKTTNDAAEMQQNVRVAYDRMMSGRARFRVVLDVATPA